MNRRPLIVAVGLTAAGAIVLMARRTGLGVRRERALATVAEVVPSKYGDAKFARLAPGYRPNDPKLPSGFTTCGYLPCFVGRELGAKDEITQCGLEQARTNGRKYEAWREPGWFSRPKPGDIYGLEKDGIIVHVGVIVDASGDEWQTADAGQGPRDAQEAKYVMRAWDPRQGTLGGRKLAGWIDLDAYPMRGA